MMLKNKRGTDFVCSSFCGLILVVCYPFLCRRAREALDVLFLVGRAFAAVGVEEVITAFGYVEGFLVAVGRAEAAEGAFFNDFGLFGIVFFFANNLFHF